ncbi:SigB/SigF/SigG family RNA polymerase sigma factor [Streptomyces sp. 1222.5]|uniref:SigB/SigF/SigG family RNA polymerase sigma factor n=1 Tax=Streptomyces sp. 1222.5 TaxID=1881026 RepID=UPI003D711E82
MLADTSTRPTGAPTPASPAARRPHDDSPDTAALFARLAELDHGPQRDALRDALVTAWLPMAHRIAGRFRDRGEPVEDLRQVAAVGLIKAVDHFDPSQGTAFESYAVPTITGEVKRHFRDHTWAMHVPRRVQELRNKVRVARYELLNTPGSHEPSVADLAACTGLTEDEITAGLEALDCFTTLSLDLDLSPSDDSADSADSLSISDTLAATDTSYDVVIDRESAKEGLHRLPERERAVLYLRFFEDMTQTRIAEHLGISQMHVSRLISRSCARIREEVLNPHPGAPLHTDTAGTSV